MNAINPIYEKVKKAADHIRALTDFRPQIALVLGSGLGFFADNIEKVAEIPYTSIPDFPVSTVSGHAGKYILGYLEQVPVICMSGRVHFYEGYAPSDAVLPIRVMGMLGAKCLFLTNAAGGINPSFEPGTLMMIKGHISSFVPSPLIGENIEKFGPRFPDMSHVYDPSLLEIIRKTADDETIPLKEGVYLQTTGPQYETPEEIRFFSSIGADAVGMSTAIEAIAANHMGMHVCGVSCITNLAAGISKKALSHDEIKETADRVSKIFASLVKQSILNIFKEELPKWN